MNDPITGTTTPHPNEAHALDALAEDIAKAPEPRFRIGSTENRYGRGESRVTVDERVGDDWRELCAVFYQLDYTTALARAYSFIALEEEAGT